MLEENKKQPLPPYLISNTVVPNPYIVQHSILNFSHPNLKFQVSLVDLFQSDIQILYNLQIDNGINMVLTLMAFTLIMLLTWY